MTAPAQPLEPKAEVAPRLGAGRPTTATQPALTATAGRSTLVPARPAAPPGSRPRPRWERAVHPLPARVPHPRSAQRFAPAVPAGEVVRAQREAPAEPAQARAGLLPKPATGPAVARGDPLGIPKSLDPA